jgi:dTDP-glucose pyrophosphorylase
LAIQLKRKVMNKKFQNLVVDFSESILFVLKKMDETKRKLLIVTQDDLFYGLVSIGDIQRAIINNISINTPIKTILRTGIIVAHEWDKIEDIKKKMLQRRNEFMPIISEGNEIIDVILWETLFENDKQRVKHKISLPIVIMAGGKGTRLAPLTNVLPKPLIPIGEKTMIEDIMDKFVDFGSNDFFISVNYKADMIKYYLDTQQNENYKIRYFQEDKPSGTAGSLHLLKDMISSTFFVTNCDIIIEQDYSEILEFHKVNKNEITIVAALKSYSIPYGTLVTNEMGLLTSIEEKPEYVFKINTGLYILEPHLLDSIPSNEFYHITTLIENLRLNNGRVGVFPISEGSWTDIGNWNEYMTHLNKNHEIK